MSSSNLPNLDYVYFRSPFFWLCLTPNSSYFKLLICLLTKFIMPISKGLIPNSILCLIPKVLLQCHVFRHFMPNSKGLPTPILCVCIMKINMLLLFSCQTLHVCIQASFYSKASPIFCYKETGKNLYPEETSQRMMRQCLPLYKNMSQIVKN